MFTGAVEAEREEILEEILEVKVLSVSEFRIVGFSCRLQS